MQMKLSFINVYGQRKLTKYKPVILWGLIKLVG